MKTVVIIENEAVELKALVDLFEHWQKEINILTAKKERAAITIMSQQQVDLVVCDLSPVQYPGGFFSAYPHLSLYSLHRLNKGRWVHPERSHKAWSQPLSG